MTILNKILNESNIVKVPTLKKAEDYLNQFKGHGRILDNNGNCIRSCRCRHSSENIVQVTGNLIRIKDPKFGFEYYKDSL